jgi:methylated-DNA-[protein]-cysteine S-methyltransferase
MTASSLIIQTPLGPVLGVDEGGAITELSFAPKGTRANGKTQLLLRLREWVRAYFAGENPAPDIPLAPAGTDFQHEVWDALRQIPYGKTRTYGDVAKFIGMKSGRMMAAQAVGQAVGANRVMFLIPCHRILAANGIGGYGGGLDKKRFLLRLEGAKPVYAKT